MKVAVLLGGTSAERDVSIVTGLAIGRALQQNGHDVLAIDCAYGDERINFEDLDAEAIIKATPPDFGQSRVELNRNILKTVSFLLEEKVDLVFLALHGGYGENGQLQALLEMMHIPYTGSDSLSSALCINKHLSKVLVQSAGIPTPEWLLVSADDQVDSNEIDEMGFPLIVKPVDQGSTVGLTKVETHDQLQKAIETARAYSQQILIEKYIPGAEITVAVLGDRALPPIEIVPKSGLYDYAAKYQKGLTEYRVPAPLTPALAETVQEYAVNAFRTLQCSDYGRIDFRKSPDDEFYFLEVNTLPGMTPTSLVPKAAKAIGISFNELVETILQTAFKRWKNLGTRD